MLELVERRIVVLVYLDKILLESLEFVFVLRVGLDKGLEFLFNFVKIVGATLNVFLSFQEEDLLFFVVGFHCFSKGVFAVFEHLNEHLKFLLQFRKRGFFSVLQICKKWLTFSCSSISDNSSEKISVSPLLTSIFFLKICARFWNTFTFLFSPTSPTRWPL